MRMYSQHGKRLVALGVALALAAAVVLLITRPPVSRGIVAYVMGAATGTRMSFGGMVLRRDGATLTGVQVAVKGAQLAQIPRIEVTYNLHDLLPGSTHRYGLHSVVIDRPRITVVHEPDGSYNLPSFGTGGNAKSGATPLNLHLRVIGGSLAVLDKTRVDPSARDVEVGAVTLNADIHSDARTVYRASMAYLDGRASYPIHGGGVIDAPGGFTLHHWTAAHIPLPQLINYALNNSGIRMRAGYLDNLDARYYGDISASASMRGARLTIAGVGAPIENMNGPLDMTSAGLTTSGLTASVAGAPVRVQGGIYDLHAPRFRLSLHTHSELARLKQLSPAVANLPLRGQADVAMLLQGPVASPLTLLSLRSSRVFFAALPLREADGRVAFDNKAANILHLTLRYAGFSGAVRGRVAFEKGRNAVEAFASANGSSDRVPYAASLLAAMPLHAALLATGDSVTNILTQGTIQGHTPGDLAAAFAIAGNGTGSVTLRYRSAPEVSKGDTLTAKLRIDHPHNTIAVLAHANGMRIDGGRAAELPGFNAGALPPVRGTFSGDLFALQQSNRLGLAGSVNVQDAAYANIGITQAHARFDGAPGNIGISSLDASGSFGTLQAHGTIAGTNHFALEGHLRGSLAQLASVAGNLPARGFVDAPVALVYDNGRSIAQVRGASFSNAAIRGVPIDSLSATVAQNGGTLDIYAARARIARSGSALASGSIGSRGSRLALSVAHLPLAALHGAGVPLQSGIADGAATATGSLNAPALVGAVVIDRAHLGTYPVSANTAFAYGGGALTLHDALIGMGPAFVALDGDVFPRYNLDAAMRAVDVDELTAFTGSSLRKQFVEGHLDASVHVTGAGSSPVIAGTFDAPEGSVNGLAFRNLRGSLNGTPADLHISGAHVVVGTTQLAFNAAVAGPRISAGLDAPHADLADFNDYFDAGDTLAGTGRVAIDLNAYGRNFASSGSVRLADVRYKRYPIGDAAAVWRTNGQTTTANADIGGEAGRVAISGTYSAHAAMNVRARLRGFDLGTWLPLLGYRVPVTGHIDAEGTARGRYPDVDLGLNASLMNGTIGRVHVEQAQVALNAARGRGRIQDALIRIPNLAAEGSGTFGLHANDPLALSLRATSSDLGKLLATLTGKVYDAGGALDTTLALDGTRANPQLRDSFTFSSLRYQKLTVPKIWGTLAGNRHQVTLEHGEIDLQRGRILASGHVPLRAPRNAPLAMNLRLDNVDFSDFQSTFPKGYRLAGTMGGAMSVGGDVDNPQFTGSIALHNGYFVGPIDQNPISHVNGTVAFDRNTIAIQALHANVGGGTMDLSGTARVPDFRRPDDSTFNATVLASNAQINSPQYFRGKIDANVTASRAKGGIPTLAGTLTIPSARIPLTAFWNPKAPQSTPAPALPLAFNLNVSAGNDVRVQSPGVDVGAQGSAAVGGTLASPTLNGAFNSTGGTVTFLRRFSVQQANVTFDPGNGIMPYVDALATTTVSNPVTDITLHVTGLAPNNMQISFDSSPAGYSREQLLAMLTGVNNLNNPNAAGGFSAGGEIQNLAMGQINTYFTQQLLEPLSASLGNALGLQNLALTDDFTGGFGFNAVKAFGKHITAVFSENLGTPQRRSLSIQAHRNTSTAFNLTFYSTDSPALFGIRPGADMFGFNNSFGSSIVLPQLGNNGFTMTYEHTF